MRTKKWMTIFMVCGSLIIMSQGCKILKKNDCGCPTMNKKRMH